MTSLRLESSQLKHDVIVLEMKRRSHHLLRKIRMKNLVLMLQSLLGNHRIPWITCRFRIQKPRLWWILLKQVGSPSKDQRRGILKENGNRSYNVWVRHSSKQMRCIKSRRKRLWYSSLIPSVKSKKSALTSQNNFTLPCALSLTYMWHFN